MFWISEEIYPSMWEPENLISSFLRCFRRLIYCVEYSICPHYFIPECNLFENKIKGIARDILLKTLNNLNSYGWQCILFSNRISNFHEITLVISNKERCLHVHCVKKILFSILYLADNLFASSFFYLIFQKGIRNILSITNSKIQYIYMYYLSTFCSKFYELHLLTYKSSNQTTYENYNSFRSILLMNTRHDAVSGWLMLASFFYATKQYRIALEILQYSLSKCTPEKLSRFRNLSRCHYELLNMQIFRKMSIVQLWIVLLLDCVMFNYKSVLIPVELQIKEDTKECIIPPVVYIHFLCFLCHYHLDNIRECQESLRALQWTIDTNYFIEYSLWKALSYNTLGISFQLLNDIHSAKQAFEQSIKLFPDKVNNSAFRRLSLLS